jgi:outer membrane protein with beta-barrel domain
MTNTRNLIVLVSGLTLAGSPGAAAQTIVEPTVYVDLNIAGQTQSTTLTTSSTFSLFGEPGATSSSSTVGKGLVFDGGAGYFVRKNLAVGLMVTVFTRSPSGTASFTTLSASPKLTQTEMGGHLKVAYLLPVRDKMDLVVAVGPSFIRLERDIANATVVNGTPQISVDTERGNAWGVHGSLDLNYRFTPLLGGGVFVRYIAAQADLPSVSGIKVGGFQGGLGLRVLF